MNGLDLILIAVLVGAAWWAVRCLTAPEIVTEADVAHLFAEPKEGER